MSPEPTGARKRFTLQSLYFRAIATASAVAIAAFVSFAPPAGAQYTPGQYSVAVNGTVVALNPAPLERGGRVYVPLRGVFEHLGASVVYANGLINATGSGHTISLRIGSNDAIVDGTTERIESPPFIVGATTYVPLRFISQALGAKVNYESSNQLVSITTAAYVAQASPTPTPPSLLVGTNIVGTLSSDINTATANVGDSFAINLMEPYPNDDPTFKGSYIRGHVASVTRAGQGTRAQLGLAFDRLVLADGRSIPIYAHVVSVEQKQKSDILKKAAGALGGMIAGNVIGKVVFKTKLGGAAGAIGGYLYAANSKDNFVVPKSSTVSVQVDVPRRQATEPPH